MYYYKVTRVPLTRKEAHQVRIELMNERLQRGSFLYERFRLHHQGLEKALNAVSSGHEDDFDTNLLHLAVETHDLGKLLPNDWHEKKPKFLKTFNGKGHPERSWEYCRSRFSGTFPKDFKECVIYHGGDNLVLNLPHDTHVFQLVDALANYYKPLLQFRMNNNRNGDRLESVYKSHERIQETCGKLLGQIDVNWNAVNDWK